MKKKLILNRETLRVQTFPQPLGTQALAYIAGGVESKNPDTELECCRNSWPPASQCNMCDSGLSGCLDCQDTGQTACISCP
jgi:hypothetical protein